MPDAFEHARQYFLDGLAHFQAQALPEAEHCFESALALMPDRVSVLTNLGATRVKLGKSGAALPLLERATAGEPGNLQAWSYLGLAHAALGQPEQALVCFDRALALDDTGAALWMQRAQTLVRLGQPAQALASFDQALALDETLAEAWSHRGTLLREMKQLPEAAASFEKALAFGADPGVHAYFLASVRGALAPANAPREYVEYLFDDYAGEFQGHLVDVLRYRAHEVLIDPLVRASRRFSSVLDLGCGTGLCGPLIAPLADRLDGVDLSRGMLDQARALGVYGELVHADVAEYLAGAARSDDLVLAADVFIYVGELAAVFAGVSRVLRPGGLFCFTLERSEAPEAPVLLPSLRYAHSEAYVRRLAARHGFAVQEVRYAPLREDQEQAVEGLYVYLVRQAGTGET